MSQFPSQAELMEAAVEGIAVTVAAGLIRGDTGSLFSAQNVQTGLMAGAAMLVIRMYAPRFEAGFTSGLGGAAAGRA